MKKICQNPNCNKEFETTSRQTKYCCDKCAKFMHKYGKEIIKYKDKCCEICGKEHDHTYGSGRFCSIHCRMKYISSKSSATQKNISKPWKKSKNPNVWKCMFCNEVFPTKLSLKNHVNFVHYNITENKFKDKENNFVCKHCGKEFDSISSLGGHSRMCLKNPCRETYLKQMPKLIEGLKKKLEAGFSYSHPHTKETKEKISTIRTELISKGIGLGGRRAKTYKLPNIKGDMFFHQGTWELNVAKQMNSIGILWIRNKKVPYIKDGVRHYYIPDYFIPEKDSYVEVKGYFDDVGKEKMRLVLEQNPGIRIYFIYNEYKSFINGKIPLNENLILTLDKIK